MNYMAQTKRREPSIAPAARDLLILVIFGLITGWYMHSVHAGESIIVLMNHDVTGYSDIIIIVLLTMTGSVLFAIARWLEYFAEKKLRKRYERGYNNDEWRIRYITDGSRIGTWDFFSQREGYLSVNSVFKSIIEDDLPKNVFSLENLNDLLSADEREKISDLLSRSLSTKDHSIEEEFEITTFHKNRKWVLVKGRVLGYDMNGNPSRISGTIQDISELVNYRSAMETANKKLNMMYTMTRHDILNQMTALQGYLELSGELETSDDLKQINAKMKRISDIIITQMDFTRDYQNMGRTSPEWQNISVVAEKVASGFHNTKVKIIITVQNLEIYADPLLEKVFYHLFDNAIRYGEKITSITISRSIAIDSLKVIVEDDGVGIKNSEKPRLFEKGSGKNVGLDLFLVREILSITGIEIEENGIPGRGARFELRVPNGKYHLLSSQSE